jgi:intracellular sulfur oxidation DsrE/DsrF family protein
MAAVIVYRHQGLPAVMNDDMWSRLKLGERTKVKDPATNEFALRNPYLKLKAGEAAAPPAPEGGGGGGGNAPLSGLDALISRGVIVVCCNLALMRHGGMLARAENMSVENARAAVIAALVPGVIRLPSGIFAVARAQEAGCHFIRST